jgi:hypothetical protein
LTAQSTATKRRDWDWDADGTLEGMYVETRPVVVRSGPSAGREKVVFDLHVGIDDELVSVWETTVLKSKFAHELRERRKPDFEPGERIVIEPLGMKSGAKGPYGDFAVEFDHAAPKRTAADLLNAADDETLTASAEGDGELSW